MRDATLTFAGGGDDDATLDLNGAEIGGGVFLDREFSCAGSIRAPNARIRGELAMRSNLESPAVFAGLLDFSGATIDGAADFGRARFLRGAHFAATRFEGPASFEHTTWGTDDLATEIVTLASFTGATFNAGADFTHVSTNQLAAWRFDDLTLAGDVLLGITSIDHIEPTALPMMTTDEVAAEHDEHSATASRPSFVMRGARLTGPTTIRLAPTGPALFVSEAVIDHPLTVPRPRPRPTAASNRQGKRDGRCWAGSSTA